MKAGSTSQITSNQHVPILNIATNQTVGYVSSEYVHTRARKGLVFLRVDKAWKIVHITDEETILVLPYRNLDSFIRSRATDHNRETHETLVKKSYTNTLHGLPTPTHELILLEFFQDYIIIHNLLGLAINTTLRMIFDAMLTEQDLIRDSYNDSIRILMQTSTRLSRDEIESIRADLSHITPREFDRLLAEAMEARFPQVLPKDNPPKKTSRVESTVIRNFKAKLATRRSKDFLSRLAQGRIKTRLHFSSFRPTPLATEIIDEYLTTSAAESDTLIKENATDLKQSIEKETAHLICLKCLSSQAPRRVSQIEERPKCTNCGSSLLGLPIIPVESVRSLFHKKKSLKLDPAETKLLAGTRRTADLILSYGKKAIIALTVNGIGPQTASTILASAETKDSEFYSDLLRARIHYLTTRELWDREQNRSLSIGNHMKVNI